MAPSFAKKSASYTYALAGQVKAWARENLKRPATMTQPTVRKTKPRRTTASFPMSSILRQRRPVTNTHSPPATRSCWRGVMSVQ